MTDYTVQVEASDAEGAVWQAVHPAEHVTGKPGESAMEVARWVGTNQLAAVGANWRVRVWPGVQADTSTDPAAVVYATDYS